MRDIKQCHPQLQDLCAKLIKKCESAGLKIGISECLRSVAEQDALYAKGRTAPGSIVTNAKGSTYSSMHQWGCAFDFYRNDGKGAYTDNDRFFTKVGKIGQSLGLEWGGSWTSPVDKPHFQLPQWGSTTTKLKNIYGTPTVFIKTWVNEVDELVKKYKKPSTEEYTLFIKRLQKKVGVKETGKATSELLNRTVSISTTINNRHNLVMPLQKYFKLMNLYTGEIDGIAGTKFANAVKAYKKKVCGAKNPDDKLRAKNTAWKKLLRL